MLLTNTQVSKIHKTFANGSSADIGLSKTQNRTIPLGLTAAATATHAAILKKMFGSGNSALMISE